MNKHPLFSKIPLILIGGLLLGWGGPLSAQDDLNLWQESVWPLLQRGPYAGTIIQHTRLRDDGTDVFFHMIKAKSLYKLHPRLHLALNHDWIAIKGTDQVWDDEYRLEAEWYNKTKIAWSTWDNRGRFDFRFIENTPKNVYWRYRHRLMVSAAPSFFNKKVTLFANEEIFYDFTREQYNQNRAFVGLGFSPAPWNKISLAYGAQSLLRSRRNWINRQILYLSAKFIF